MPIIRQPLSVIRSPFLPVVAFFLLAARPAGALDIPPEPATISTTGTAEIHVPADTADLNFSVNIRLADLNAARKKQAERAAKVLAALKAAGVEDKDLQTSQVNIAATYVENRRGETATINYYDVTQTIVCTLHDVKKVADVTTQIVSAGATEVGEVSLRLAEPRKTRDEARAQAARAAREKAEALARELGAKVGKPYKISEGGDGDQPMAGGRAKAMSANASTTVGEAPDTAPEGVFAPGLLTISANVEVVFYLE